MTVEELYQQLSHGELSNLEMAVDASGTIRKEQHPRIILFANQALGQLYARFLLDEKSILLRIEEGKTEYQLPPSDMIKVLAIFNERGQSFPLSESQGPRVISTLPPNLLRIPTALISRDGPLRPGSEVEVVYQAKHPRLDPEQLDQEILLPPALHEALTAFIAYKVYAGMNTQETLSVAAGHQTRFQYICNEAVQYNLVNTGYSHTNTKLEKRGWI